LGTGAHLLQFADIDENQVARNVAQFLFDGVVNGEPCMVMATEAHLHAFRDALLILDKDLDLTDRQTFCFLNAQDVLDALLLDGAVNAARFDQVIGSAVRELSRSNSRKTRGFGEMVGLLWSKPNFSAAIRLEHLFNRLLSQETLLRIFCYYPIDVFGSDFDSGILDPLLCTHTHLLSGAGDGKIEKALMSAIQETAELPHLPHRTSELVNRKWATLPRGESMILRLKLRDPDYADEILDRARDHYQSSRNVNAH
jgi:hypothetical protein